MADVVSQFLEAVEAFGGVFDQLSLRCVTVKNEDKWVSVYTGLILSNSADSKTLETKIVAGSQLIALSVSYPTKAFEALIKEIESGNVSVACDTESYQIFMTRAVAGLKPQNTNGPRFQFQNVWRPPRQFSGNEEAFQPTIFLQAMGDNFCDVLSNDDNERISKSLRAGQPAYDGLEGLCKFFGCRYLPNISTQASVEVKAILPFKTAVREDQLFVECPSAFAPKISARCFLSGHESVRVSYSQYLPVSDRKDWVSIPFAIEWPTNVAQAEADVLYDGQELERVTVRHWASGANWRVLADGYFDPGSKLLKEALNGGSQNVKDEKRSEAFEQAIVRLLNLGGIAATWHGALRVSGKPDLAAYCEVPGRRIVLVGECTLEKPNAKLSSLRARLGSLLERVGNSAELLAVVFTACDPVPSDYSDAAQANITLVGRNELGWLVGLVERNAGAAEIINK